MNILLTGHTGFLGKHLIGYLQKDHSLTTIDRVNADIICDLSVQQPRIEKIDRIDCVVHSAGKAHVVPKSPEEAAAFFAVNFKGTQNLCAALEHSDSLPASFVFISTVAVYGQEWGTAISEKSALNGTSPYAKSKIAAEDWLIEWSQKNNICLTIFRLPLVAGPNPPGNLGAMINGIRNGRYFRIGKGNSRKSIVLASDVARIIPKAAQIGGIYNLTDGHDPSFSELEELISSQLGKAAPKAIPMIVAKALGWVGNVVGRRFPVNSETIKKITSDLTFDDSKAREKLGWAPSKVLDHFKIA